MTFALLVFSGNAAAQCPWLLSNFAQPRGTVDGLLFARIASAVPTGSLLPNTGVATGDSELNDVIDMDLRDRVQLNRLRLDLNDNGVFDIFDAGIAVRHLLGFKNDSLVAGGAGPGALRTTGAQMQSYIDGGCIATRRLVGGTVIQLTTPGVVLANAGTDLTPLVANATTFAMTTAVTVGGSYNISVSSQPAGGTCRVLSPSGTVGTSNVTSVVVDCGPPGFTIGGTISNLRVANAGLVLQNNLGDFTSVSPGAATFTMNTRLATGASYSISVKTQPIDAFCYVASGGTGTVGSANITDVEIRCGNPGCLLPGAKQKVGGGGRCADGLCTAICGSFNRDCCSNRLLFAGTCTDTPTVPVGTTFANCDCICQ